MLYRCNSAGSCEPESPALRPSVRDSRGTKFLWVWDGLPVRLVGRPSRPTFPRSITVRNWTDRWSAISWGSQRPVPSAKVASYRRLVASYRRLVASYRRLVASYRRLVASYRRLVASYRRLVASYRRLEAHGTGQAGSLSHGPAAWDVPWDGLPVRPVGRPSRPRFPRPVSGRNCAYSIRSGQPLVTATRPGHACTGPMAVWAAYGRLRFAANPSSAMASNASALGSGTA